jgi:hypothetical protein
MLKVGDKFFFGLLLFGLLFGALTVLPYIDRNPSRKFKDRRVALTGLVVALIALGFLTYAGLAEYGIQETATSELVFEWVPGEGEGKVDHVRFEALPKSIVTYDTASGGFTAGNEGDLTPEVKELFEEFKADVAHWRELDQPFAAANGSAALTIAPWQTDKQGNVELQKVTLVISVDGKPQAPAVRFLDRTKDNPAQ